MHGRTRTAPLAESEATKTRNLVKQHGAEQAARLLGLCDSRTVRKAACGEPVHPLTAAVIRAKLPDAI